MTKNQQLAFIALAGVAATQFIIGTTLVGKFVEQRTKYNELYELAVYMAGKAEGAGVELDEADRIAMELLRPSSLPTIATDWKK